MPRSVARKRDKLWHEQNGRCYYCNRQVRLEDATLEHILPRALKGTNRYANLAMACFDCNQERGAEINKILSETRCDVVDPKNFSAAEQGVLSWNPFASLLNHHPTTDEVNDTASTTSTTDL